MLEDLANKFNGSADNECSVELRDVLEPAIILIRSERIIQDLDNDQLIIKLKDHSIELNEVTLEQRATLQRKDEDLYTRMVLVQRSRDYLKHKNDIAYIRNAYEEMITEFRNSDRFNAFNIVRKVVRELKDPKNQKCSFDFDQGMLKLNAPDMIEALREIQQDKHACNLLIDFCEKLTAMKSNSSAIIRFEDQANADEISFNTKFKWIYRQDYSYSM